ncbi:ATP-binding cassette domain-containing protein, partial [Phocaeicola vulgatus]|nr:ATP-binding cassette domain-containing protein [Phocaeicola vulgatus]
EDRKVQSIFPVRSVEDNISVSTLERFESFGMLRKHKIRDAVGKLMQKVNIASRLQQTPIVNLSGGNQQKAIFARWMMRIPDVLILDEPTSSLDDDEVEKLFVLMRRLRD